MVAIYATPLSSKEQLRSQHYTPILILITILYSYFISVAPFLSKHHIHVSQKDETHRIDPAVAENYLEDIQVREAWSYYNMM